MTKLADKAMDGTTATIKTYGGGKDGAEVVLASKAWATLGLAGSRW